MMKRPKHINSFFMPTAVMITVVLLLAYQKAGQVQKKLSLTGLWTKDSVCLAETDSATVENADLSTTVVQSPVAQSSLTQSPVDQLPPAQPIKSSGSEKKPPYEPINLNEILQKMSLQEKVGQIVMAGYDLYSYPDKTERGWPESKDIEQLITDFKLGNIILYCPPDYPASPQEVAELTNRLQKLACQSTGIPLFIAADQEGGRVVRFRKGMTVFPGNMALGATRSAEYAYLAGRIMAEELRAVGINVNLAPVLDVQNNPDNPVINIRSFGEDPRLVADLGQAFIRGSLDGKIIPVAKHFPGHGDTSIDSHYGLPTVRYGAERLNNIELLPFSQAIKADIPMIMPAHITFPSLEPTPGLPATLSEKIITGLLKQDMGFKGVVLCDDIEMSAITNSYGSCARAAVKSFLAGTDIIMVAHTYSEQIKVCQELLEALRNGTIPPERLDESVRAILQLKSKIYSSFSQNQVLVDTSRIETKVGKEQNKNIALKIARQSATLVQDDGQLIPLRVPPKSAVLYLNPLTGADNDLLGQQLKNHYPNTQVLNLSEFSSGPDHQEQKIQMLLNQARESDLVVAGMIDHSHIKIIKALSGTNRPLIVISFGQPYFLKEFPLISTYLCLYSHQACSVQAAADVLLGRTEPQGALPVSIPGIYDLEYKGLKQPTPTRLNIRDKYWLGTIAGIILCLFILVLVRIRAGLKTRPNLLDKIVKQRIRLDKLIEEYAHQCTFVSIDVVESLKMKSGMDKVRISYSFDRYYDYVRGLVEKNGGQIFSTAGDGIMCLFKKPQEAVRSAQQVIKQLPEFNHKENQLKLPFRLRIGVNTGEVLLNQKKPNRNIFDAVIDIASHIQKKAKPEEVVISETTYNQLQEKGGFVRSPEISEAGLITYYWQYRKV